jgi:hypothetical protein
MSLQSLTRDWRSRGFLFSLFTFCLDTKSNKKVKAAFNLLDFLSLAAVTLSEPLALQARLLRITVWL